MCNTTPIPRIQDIEKALSLIGWTLLSKEYTNSRKKLSVLCPKGHQQDKSWGSFTKGRGCRVCAGQVSPSIEFIRSEFEQKGWKLLESEYVSWNHKMRFLCDRGHNHEMNWNNFKSGLGCYYCSNQVVPSIDQVRDEFAARGLALLSDDYKNNGTLLNFRCKDGHIGMIRRSNLLSGNNCRECSKNGFSFSKPATFYYARFAFKGKFYYKIGVTNRSAKERLFQEKTPHKIIYEQRYETGEQAYEREQKLLKRFQNFKIDSSQYFLRNGNTEVFTWDVLNLDRET